MDTKKLEYLLRLDETRSYTEAAKQLYITQSALSQAISGLEKYYGTDIFVKKGGRLCLTAEGEAIVKAARREYFLEENLRQELLELKNDVAGDVKVGLSPGRAVQFLPRVLPAMWKRYPKVRVIVSTRAEDGFEQAVCEGKLDFAFVMDMSDVTPEVRCELQYDKLFSYVALLAVPPWHALASETIGHFNWRTRRAVSLKEMEGVPLVTDPVPPRVQRWTNAVYSAYQFTPEKMVVVSGALTRLDLVLAGVGWSITQESQALVRRQGAFFRLDKGEFAANLCLITRRDKYLTQPMRYFIELVKEHSANGLWTTVE